jgi:hypothetical protein
MTTLRHTIAPALFALAVGTTGPGIATAEDGKVYPGALCEKELGVFSYAAGQIRNNSNSGSLTVSCPIVRDAVSGGVNDAYVRAYSAHSSGVWCQLHTRSTYGTAGFLQGKSAGGTGYKGLSYASMSDYNGGFYYFWCAVPPSNGATKSRIIAYRMDEK